MQILCALEFFLVRTPMSTIPYPAFGRSAQRRVCLFREESLGSHHTNEFANGVVPATVVVVVQRLACIAAPLPRAPSIRLFISSFLGSLQLSPNLSIHGLVMVMDWIIRAVAKDLPPFIN
jgi:hypothetical protein